VISKLNGDKLNVTILKASETDVEFLYPGETVTQIISKKLVQSILYKSGREEKINEKVRVFSESDYYLVTITMEEKEVAGLRRIADISAKQSVPYGGRTKLREKALVKLKKESAVIGGHIILLQSDEFSNSPINTVSLSGVAYGY
jgi:low affinity Fe/Cu permease